MTTDRTIVTTARSAVGAGVVLAVAGSTLSLASGEIEFWWRASSVVALFTLCFAVFVWLVIARQPRNAAVWTGFSSRPSARPDTCRAAA